MDGRTRYALLSIAIPEPSMAQNRDTAEIDLTESKASYLLEIYGGVESPDGQSFLQVNTLARCKKRDDG
jgi:hypothetical protein